MGSNVHLPRAARVLSAVLGAAAATALAACSSSSGGHPTPPPTSTSRTSTAPTTPSSSASSSAGSTGSCVTGANYCEQFSSSADGWPTANTAHYFAGYDKYLGGTYRMGERSNAALSEDAPYKVTDAANDYSIQVDVDATLATTFPASDFVGVTCWEHPIMGGGGAVSAFLLEINSSQALIGLWDNVDGRFHQIASSPTSALNRTGTNHLTASCLQASSNSGAQADLSLTVNGTKVVSAKYAKSVNNYSWEVGDKVGLLAIGQGSDVFYDNFAITGK